MKSMLWVYHRIRRIKNRTSDGKVIKKRRLKIKIKKMKGRKKNENDDDDESGRKKEVHVLLKWQTTLIL